MSGPQYSAQAPRALPQTQTSFYQNASNFSIGTQNVTIHNGPHISSLVSVQLPQAIPNADHNRNRKISPPDSDCLPGTRTSLRENILSWAQSPQSSQVILWLCGSAGSGKSAVAQAVAGELDRSHRLAASFFFFRGSGERSRFARFPITLANQIASAVPGAGKYVWEAAARLSGWSVRKQMEELVYGPIQRAFADNPREGPVIIVIDGLDECEDRHEVEEFIDHLLEYFDEHPPLNFRLIISSRIEEHIQSRLETRAVWIENLASHLPHEDILTFLTASFSRAAGQSRVVRAYGKWPTDVDLRALLKHISGSFIFAATLVKYILGPSTSDGLTPMERLPLALNMNPGLDGLYAETLKRCCTFPHFTEIIAAIGLAFQAHAIIHVPGDDQRTPITLFHSSLRDFLVTESRSGPFFISPVHHEQFAFRWLEAVQPPKHRTSVDFCPQCFQQECSTLRRALWHWESPLAWVEPRHFQHSSLCQRDHWTFLPSGPSTDDLALVRIAAEYGPFRELVGSVPAVWDALATLGTYHRLQGVLAGIGPGITLHNPPPVISIVRDGIRFFNGTLGSSSSLALASGCSGPSNYILRHWVKHLGDAVRRDATLTSEFLLQRDYGVAKAGLVSKHSALLNFNDLRNDVLSAQNAIENRFPGILPKFDTTQASDLNVSATFYEHTDLERVARPSISEGGLSVLDIFNVSCLIRFGLPCS
ncbi:hypothetical protein FA13DRAFT_1793436 [Coprinellus micaceus]|uniref:Nephrocystin 3-like N-terminal domain-containing protein n=1 Tax=Coprinellus micaceus TaxID=71717 RepID=A0A4Y7T440_COPMI|nr:hypothetical protein FA13DRAFT_1793436 [Coprinellus micaceus]